MTSLARDWGGEFWGNRLELDSGAMLLGPTGASHKMPVRMVYIREAWGLVGSVAMILWWRSLQFLGGLVATIFLDIIYISIFYSSFAVGDTGRFGAGMAILSLLLKPFSCCLVYHMHRERGGELPLRPGKSLYPTSPWRSCPSGVTFPADRL